MHMENLRNDTNRGKPIYPEYACTGSPLYTANPKSTAPYPPNTLQIGIIVGTVHVRTVPETTKVSLASVKYADRKYR
jgi:hypothetical protein